MVVIARRLLQRAPLALSLAGFTLLGAPAIRVNSIGFLPDQAKAATIAGDFRSFRVIRESDGAAVLSADCLPVGSAASSGGDLRIADFSRLTAPGRYRLEGGGSRSAPFSIGAEVWVEPFNTVFRGFYLWRCGMAVGADSGGRRFAHAACHTNDAWLDLVGGGHVRRVSVGGWHDAGDYNKYVVNAGAAVGVLLRAWNDFGPAIRRAQERQPVADRAPDFLGEIRWELEWLLTMQTADGGVYHKLTTRGFGKFEAPETEATDRFFTPVSSAATADFAAMMSEASRTYLAVDPAFAARCGRAAGASWSWLCAHPGEKPFEAAGVSTGAYASTDADDRLWAAAGYWQATGDPGARQEAERRLRMIGARIDTDWDWGNLANLGALEYLFSDRPDADPSLKGELRRNLIAAAASIAATGAAHGYGRPLGNSYYWGDNGSVARQAVALAAGHRLDPRPEFRQAALDALGHLFGRNVTGRSMVTGLGFNPPLHPHDRRSAIDPDGPPWPGYLIGGPHPGPADWHDEQADYRTNEIAINWNAALVYALAGFLPGADF